MQDLVLPQVLLEVLGQGVGGAGLPVAMKRCVASNSCGEIFTLISESESLNREKSCRLLSRCGTLCFFRLSAIGAQGKDDTQNHCWSLEVYTDSLRPHTFCSASCRRHNRLSPRRRRQAADGLALFALMWLMNRGRAVWGFLSRLVPLPVGCACSLCISICDCFNPCKRAMVFSSFSTHVVFARPQQATIHGSIHTKSYKHDLLVFLALKGLGSLPLSSSILQSWAHTVSFLWA